jgi:LysM repeat protein
MQRRASALSSTLACTLGALLAITSFSTSLHAANSSAPESGSDELKTLHDMIEQQSRQIDVLAQEVARLNLLLEARTPTAQGLAPAPASEPETPPSYAPPTSRQEKAAPPDETAAPAPGGPVHIVTKGETLTAIARHYKVSLPDLLKFNKITDVRRLQIGQTLHLPPDAKIPDASAPSSAPETSPAAPH